MHALTKYTAQQSLNARDPAAALPYRMFLTA